MVNETNKQLTMVPEEEIVVDNIDESQLFQLTDRLLIGILQLCDGEDICRLSRVCRRLHRLIDTNCQQLSKILIYQLHLQDANDDGKISITYEKRSTQTPIPRLLDVVCVDRGLANFSRKLQHIQLSVLSFGRITIDCRLYENVIMPLIEALPNGIEALDMQQTKMSLDRVQFREFIELSNAQILRMLFCEVDPSMIAADDQQLFDCTSVADARRRASSIGAGGLLTVSNRRRSSATSLPALPPPLIEDGWALHWAARSVFVVL